MDDQCWWQLLEGLASPDPDSLEDITRFLTEFFESSPEACLVAIEKASNVRMNQQLRRLSLIIANTPLKKALKSSSPEIKDEICRQALELIVKMSKDNSIGDVIQFRRQLSGLFRTIFMDWGEDGKDALFEILTEQVPPIFATICFGDILDHHIPNETIINLTPFLFGLVQQFLRNTSVFREVSTILVAILDVEHPELDLEPVARYFLEVLYSGKIDMSDLDHCIYVIADLMDEEVIPITELENIVQLLAQTYPEQIRALSGFEDMIEKIPNELIVSMVNLTVQVVVMFAKEMCDDLTHGSLYDDLDFCRCVLEQKGDSEMAGTIIGDLMASGGAEEKCVAICILGFMISYCPEVHTDSTTIYEILSSAIKSGVKNEFKVALSVLAQLEDVSSNVISIFADLINDTLDVLLESSDLDSDDLSIAVRALGQMCTLCDEEIEGLLAKTRRLSEMIEDPNIVSDFYELIASVISLTSELDDEDIDSLIETLEQSISTGDELVQAACLKIIGALIDKVDNDTLVDILLPISSPLVPELLKLEVDNEDCTYNNEQVINSTMWYLDKLADAIKENAVELIDSSIVELIQTHITIDNNDDCPNRTENALGVLACYSRYADDEGLVEYLVDTISSLLGYTERPYLQYWGACTLIKMRSPKLAEVDGIVEIFDCIVEILMDDHLTLDDAHGFLVAVGVLFKYCRGQNLEHFLEDTMQVIDYWLEKTDAAGENIFTSPTLSRCLDDLMQLIGRVFKSKEADVNPICTSLVDPFKEGSEMIRYTILGVFIDAVEYNEVDEEIVTTICETLAEDSGSISNIDLQQNVCYFMNMLLRRFPQYVELGSHMYPIVQEWWRFGSDKKSGCAEMLENAASFFLSYARADPEALDEEVLTAALGRFPPVIDVKETESMLETLCHMIEEHGEAFSAETHCNIALSLARLFTETESKTERRCISQEVMETAKGVFKTLMENAQIAESVRESCQRKKAKVAMLDAVLSA